MVIWNWHGFQDRVHSLVAGAGTNIKVRCFLGLKVLDSDRGMETVIFR
jgi:hypothetical protein